MTAPAILAHAFGSRRYELPLPLILFVLGGAAVVLLSFLLVLPRRVAAGEAGGAEPEAALPPAPRSRVPSLAAGAILVALLIAGWRGSQEVSENILPTAFWILAWVGVPISCVLVGDWTRHLNPMAAAARAADREGLRRRLLGGGVLPWPQRVGWWPSVLIFFLIAAGEVIFTDVATRPAVTASALVAYWMISAAAGLLFGAEAWNRQGEVFSVLYGTWGRLGWFRFGAAGRRGPSGGLEAPFAPRADRITFVLLLLVSVSYDGLLATDAWRRARLHLPGGVAPGTAAYLALATIGFLVLTALAWTLFGLFAGAVRRAGGLSQGRLRVLAGLLPSLMPISAGYLIAHNVQYLALGAQQLIPLAGDPLGLGWHLLPAPFNDSYVPDGNLIPSAAVWYGQVALIIGVHVAAVVLAHRHLGRAAVSVARARRSEWPWIAAMVGYTMTSLWLLSQPLVEEHAQTAGVISPACICALS